MAALIGTPALPRPHLRRRAPRLRRQDRLRHRQSRAGAGPRRCRARGPRLPRRASDDLDGASSSATARSGGSASRRRPPIAAPASSGSMSRAATRTISPARQGAARHSRRRRQRPGRDRDPAALRPDRRRRDPQPARARRARDRGFATGWSRSACGSRAGKVNSLTPPPARARPRRCVEQMEAGKILDPGDLVAAFARAISNAARSARSPRSATSSTIARASSSRATSTGCAARSPRIRSEAIAFRRFVAPDRDALRHPRRARFRLAGRGRPAPHPRGGRPLRPHGRGAGGGARARGPAARADHRPARRADRPARALISIVAFIFLPLTFITGLLGMNVDGIPYAHDATGPSGASSPSASVVGARRCFRLMFWLRR